MSEPQRGDPLANIRQELRAIYALACDLPPDARQEIADSLSKFVTIAQAARTAQKAVQEGVKVSVGGLSVSVPLSSVIDAAKDLFRGKDGRRL